MKYTLMNGIHEVLEFDIDSKQKRINNICICDGFNYAPLYFKRDKLKQNMLSFMHMRSIDSKRRDANNIFKALGVENEYELALRSYGLSLTDCYWYRPYGSELNWKDINCFDRNFDTTFGSALLRHDYKTLKKANFMTPDCTLGGICKKAWIRINGELMLLKSEASQAKFVERSELLASELTKRLLKSSDYIEYRQVKYFGEDYIACPCMIKLGEEFIPAGYITRLLGKIEWDSFKIISKDKKSLDLFTKVLKNFGMKNIESYFAKLGAVFNLTLSGDCHVNNFGFIRDSKSMKLRPAPLFDRGRSFGSFGQPMVNGDISVAKYAIKSPQAMFFILLFNSIVLHSEWDYSWYDPASLYGFENEIGHMLKDCADNRYIELLKTGYNYQLDYLNKVAGVY